MRASTLVMMGSSSAPALGRLPCAPATAWLACLHSVLSCALNPLVGVVVVPVPVLGVEGVAGVGAAVVLLELELPQPAAAIAAALRMSAMWRVRSFMICPPELVGSRFRWLAGRRPELVSQQVR